MTHITLPRAVVQQVREALIVATTYLHDDADLEFEQSVAAIDAIDEALAQPAPTPELLPLSEPDERAAYDMGAKGGAPSEAERLLFEAWMRGHCWALCAHWDGKQYVSDAEQGGELDPRAMATRRLFAAWRDRAALAQRSAEPALIAQIADLDARATEYAALNDRQAARIAALTEAARLGLEALKVLTESGGIGPEDMFDDARAAIAALSAALPAHQKEGGQQG